MKYFGTDGIRGVVNQNLTAQFAYKLGLSLANYFGKKNKVCIGCDARLSSPMLLSAIATGLMEGGVNVTCVGIVSTPALCFVTKKHKFDFGIMITASHNPPEYNGIKIFNSLGEKLSPSENAKIEKIIDFFELKNVDVLEIGQLSYNKTLVNSYINYLIKNFKNINTNFKICIDCANGATSELVKKLVKKLNLNATLINTSSDGRLVNYKCGATYIQNLKQYMKNNNFDVGFSFDGDGDRIIVVNNLNNVLDGDDILYLFALNLNKLNELNSSIVATSYSNFGLDNSLKKFNIKVNRVDAGDSSVYNEIKQNNLVLGGERSGHIIFKNHLPCGDGIYVMLKVLEFLTYNKINLNKAPKFKKYYLVEKSINANNSQKQKVMDDINFKNFLFTCDEMLVKDGRMLVRPSGTENLIRILVECISFEKAKNVASIIGEKIEDIISKL